MRHHHWLYVYYRLPQAQEARVLEQTRALFAALAQLRKKADQSFLAPRLMRRPELRDGEITFMEVYGPMADIDLPVVKAQLETLLPAFEPLSVAARHSEHFIDLACV